MNQLFCVRITNKPATQQFMSKPNSTAANDVRKEGLDKFYTVPDVSKRCIDVVFARYEAAQFDLIVEPSAGNGSFLHQLGGGTVHFGRVLAQGQILCVDKSPKYFPHLNADNFGLAKFLTTVYPCFMSCDNCGDPEGVPVCVFASFINLDKHTLEISFAHESTGIQHCYNDYRKYSNNYADFSVSLDALLPPPYPQHSFFLVFQRTFLQVP